MVLTAVIFAFKMSNNYCEKSIWNEFSNSNSSVRVDQDEKWRNENYQNNIKQGVRPKVQQSISTVQPVHITDDSDDNDSTNSISESLNNYLDMKVKDVDS